MVSEYIPGSASVSLTDEEALHKEWERTVNAKLVLRFNGKEMREVFNLLYKSARRNANKAGFLHDAVLCNHILGEIAVQRGLAFCEYDHNSGTGKPVLCKKRLRKKIIAD